MADKVSVARLRKRIDMLKRALLRDRLATEAEIAEAVSRFKGKRGKDSLWEQWAILRGMVIGRKSKVSRVGSIHISEESLEVAVRALRDESVVVELDSIGDVEITPASWDRVQATEEHEWWLNKLIIARSFLIDSANSGENHDIAKGKVCPECERPLEPGKLDALLKDIRKEMNYQRAMLLAQITAPTPEPVEEPVTWASRITPVEEQLLKEAYHRVNFDRLQTLPTPRSEDGQRELPQSWSFMFSAMEDRHRKPAKHFMKNRSLASIMAYLVVQSVKDQAMRDQAKAEAAHDGKTASGRRSA